MPLPPYTADEGWLRALREVVPDAVRRFSPDVLVTQLGCDTHHTDPLAHLGLTTTAYREAARSLHALAHDVAGGRWVATGGGGYQWARVVPRAWTIYFAEMVEREPPDELPREWLELAAAEGAEHMPDRLSEEPPSARDDVPEIDSVLADLRGRLG